MDNATKVMRRRSRSSEPQRQYDGVPLPGRPAKPVPEIPLNLTDLGADKLMELFAVYVAWGNFLDVQRVFAEVEEATAETELKALEATGIAGGWVDPKESRVTVLRAEAKLEPGYIEAQERFDSSKARRKVLA